MDRIEVLVSNPKRTLGLLALVLLAVGVAVGSGANFTAQSANPSNTFTAGDLEIDNSLEGAAILNASAMKPGDVAEGTVDIKNAGTVDGDFSLSRTNLVDTPASPAMSSQLNVLVEDCGNFSSGTPTCEASDTDVYTGTLAAMNASLNLGNYAADEQHRFKFTVTFSAGAPDSYEGAQSTATFQWDAVS
jgi:hypothetical protein